MVRKPNIKLLLKKYNKHRWPDDQKFTGPKFYIPKNPWRRTETKKKIEKK